jgi:regulator of sigma E protease
MEHFYNFFHNSIAFMVIISFIVFIHELGHYLVARLAGVKVEEFSIGFGPELYGFNDKRLTRWKVCLIPMGGYVKMFGDKDPSSSPDMEKIEKLSQSEKDEAFFYKPLKWRMAIVAAGPIANYLLAIVILTFFFSYYGVPYASAIVSDVLEGSAANEAKIQANDKILKLDNFEIDNFSDIQKFMTLNQGEDVIVTLARGDDIISTNLTPKVIVKKDLLGNDIRISQLGIKVGNLILESIPIPFAIIESIKECYSISTTTIKALGQIVVGKRGTEELGGTIKIARYSGETAKMGVNSVLWFIAMISINLGLVNLFPLPVLDGGHLFFYVIEGIMGKPLPKKIQQISFQIGLILIIMLFVFLTIQDIKELKIF